MKLLTALWGGNGDERAAFRREAATAQSLEELAAIGVAYVAPVADKPRALQQRAELAAAVLSAEALMYLRPLLHRPPRQPAAALPRFAGLGGWTAACQIAVFEILYALGPAALPLLRDVLAGSDDTVMPHAITILCRFALDGVQRTPITDELAAALPSLPFEVLVAAVADLAKLLPRSLPLQNALDQAIEDWQDCNQICVLDLIGPLVDYAPHQALHYEHYLRTIMRASSTLARDAAALLLRLSPSDKEARGFLRGPTR